MTVYLQVRVGRVSDGREVVASVSDDDSHLAQFKWNLGNSGYVRRSTRAKSLVRNGNNARTVFLHREVMGVLKDDSVVVDHLNCDKLDCRRENLEIVSSAENCRRALHSRYSIRPCRDCGQVHCECPPF